MSPTPVLATGRFLAFIALGANLGDAPTTLRQAAQGIGALPDTDLLAGSSLYRTVPVDATGPDYTNAIVLVSTALGPLELLHGLQGLELAHGRARPHHHAPRTLDLDVIWHGGLALNGPELTLPHPRYDVRAFVLEPLAEVLANLPAGLKLQNMPAMPDAAIRLALAQKQGIEKTPSKLLEY
ncbi:MAG TPA: 2-amino-4-hydroxy-6-hydroxymethyldihydropteridine diphosphokinase [Aquabacterium sp.]|nr:2-amino-4-hydroxy-6-hydroxymethyldihydropteridine diphosphokinase [Aquabacterium sp.]HRH29700.1 2-amino-4-hydroxy-6-hydroxymethyldihydropteridine diphosphokinase [Aquabacterium sp.]